MRALQRSPFRGLPREVPILTAVSFTVALGYGIVAPSIPASGLPVRREHRRGGQCGQLFRAYASGGRTACLLWPMDRFSEKRIMVIGIAVVAVSSVLAGFSGSFEQLIVLRGSGGLGSAMYTVSAQALLLGRVPAHQRGRASGIFSAGFIVGGISGPAVGGLVAVWSLRAPFIIYGFLLVVPAMITMVVLPDMRPGAAGRTLRDARQPAMTTRAWRARANLAAASATFADGFAAIGVRSAIVPLFVRDVLHQSAIWTGVGFLLFAALNAAALLPGGWAARHARQAAGHRRRLCHGSLRFGDAGVTPQLHGPPGGTRDMRVRIRIARRRAVGDDRGPPPRPGRDTGRVVPDGGRRRAVTGPVAAGLLVDTPLMPQPSSWRRSFWA